MVHIVFDTSSIGYSDFIQTGEGGEVPIENETYAIFRGGPPYQQRGYGIQSGAGIGDVLRGLWRFFLPIVRKVGTSIGEEALSTGQRVMDRVKQGEPIKEAFISEGKKGVDTVLEKGGLPTQFGTGIRKRRRQGIKGSRNSQNPLSYQTIIGKTISKPVVQSKKRLRSDAFGLY